MKKLIILIVIVILLGVGYTIFFKKDDKASSSPLSSSTGVTDNNNPGALDPGDDEIGRQFLTTLLSLKTINLNADIFEKPGFKNLRDYTTELLQTDPKGRPNPFAPIGVDVGSIEIVDITAGAGNAVNTGASNSSANSPIKTLPAESITKTGAKLVGEIDPGYSNVTRWFEFGLLPLVLDTKTPNSTGSGVWSATLATLKANTTFYYRACGMASGVQACGNTLNFKTLP